MNFSKILIINDSEVIQKCLNKYFRKKIYIKFVVCDDKNDCIAAAENEKPDIIILNETINGTNAFEICKKLKKKKTTSNIPIIFLTSRTESKYISKAYHSGISDYIKIPINRDDFISKIEMYLELNYSKQLVQKNEQKLSEINTGLKYLLSQPSTVIYTCSVEKDYPITFISGNVSSILGYAPSQFTNDPNFRNSLIHPDDINNFKCRLKDLFEKKNICFEYRMLHKDGNYRWIYEMLELAFDENSKPVLITGTILVDILKSDNSGKPVFNQGARQIASNNSEQLTSEDFDSDSDKNFQTTSDVRDSETRYRNLFEYSPISLWKEDASELKRYIENLKKIGIKNFREFFDLYPEQLKYCAKLIKVLDINQATIKLYKVKDKLSFYSGLNTIFTEKSYMVFKEELLTLIDGKTYFSSEIEQVQSTGEKIDTLLTVSLFENHSNDWSKLFVSIVDITTLKKTEKSLVECKTRFCDVADLIPQIIFETDTEGNITYSNRRGFTAFGYKTKDLAKKIHITQTVIPDEKIKMMNSLRNILAGKPNNDKEFTALRKDGTTFPILIYALPIINERRIIGTRGLIIDISEQKETELKLRHYSNELEKGNVELKAYAHTVAHDLKAPLTSIMGYVDLVAKKCKKEGECRREVCVNYLERTLKIIYKMECIINDLLLLASARNNDVSVEPLNMRDIVNNALAHLDYFIQESKTEITVQEIWPESAGYAPWIEEVWMNYIMNGIKYSGRPPKLQIGAFELNSTHICCWVQDNGKGIPEDKLKELFMPFKRLGKNSDNGSGLGLYIVKTIINKLGGEVFAATLPEGGCIFSFTLPKKN